MLGQLMAALPWIAIMVSTTALFQKCIDRTSAATPTPAVTDAYGLAQIGGGPYVLVCGCVVLTVVVFILRRKLEPRRHDVAGCSERALVWAFALYLAVFTAQHEYGSQWVAANIRQTWWFGFAALGLQGIVGLGPLVAMGRHQMVAALSLERRSPVVAECLVGAATFYWTLCALIGFAVGLPWIAGAAAAASPGPFQHILLVIILGPCLEEVIYRGVFYSALRARFSTLPSAMVVSLVFAASHRASAEQMLGFFAMSMVYCCVREWRGTIYAPTIAHITHNSAITLVLLVN